VEGIIIDIPFEPGETINLTVYSDLHLDAEACALRRLKEHMQMRAALPRSYFALIGDAGNWIMPHGQDPRFTPSTAIEKLAAKDAYVNEVINYHIEHLKGFPWLFMGIGNHELTMLKRHGCDVMSFICDKVGGNEHPYRLDVRHGWYSGLTRYRFNRLGGHAAGASSTFTQLYHHGFATGQASDGIPPAISRWAMTHDGWNLCTYGHNRRMAQAPVSKVRMTQNGKIVHYDAWIQGTGTFNRAEKQGGPPDYSEVRGFRPVYIGAPLIKIRPGLEGDASVKWSIETGDC